MTDLLVKVLGDGIEQRPGVDRRQFASLLSASAVRKLVPRAGEHARITFPVHRRMLRHGCGFKRANEGHDIRVIQHYLEHRTIQHSVRYTELAADWFNGFWKD